MTVAPVTLSTTTFGPYRPLAPRATWARRALVLAVVVDVLSIASGLAELRLLDRASAGGATTAELLANDRRQGLVAMAQLGILVVGAVFFLRWFHRAHGNLRPLGTEPRHSSGWAVGYWFVPILNLFRPKQIADEIWRGSEPGSPERPPRLLSWWWAAFVGAGILAQAASRVDAGAEVIADFRTASWLFLASDVAGVAAGLLALAVVSRTTARQEAAARRLATGMPS